MAQIGVKGMPRLSPVPRQELVAKKEARELGLATVFTEQSLIGSESSPYYGIHSIGCGNDHEATVWTHSACFRS